MSFGPIAVEENWRTNNGSRAITPGEINAKLFLSTETLKKMHLVSVQAVRGGGGGRERRGNAVNNGFAYGSVERVGQVL